ncbi:MAG: AfsR/SARP family transcriptional regulator [Burkholderiaceae bacterium]
MLVASHGGEALRNSHLLTMSQLAAPCAKASAPRIALWQARALLGNDNLAALEACERAHAGYETSTGKAFAAALALFIVFGAIENAGAMTPWVERFKTVSRSIPDNSSDQQEHAIRLAAEVMHDLLVGGRSASDDDTHSIQDRLFKAVVMEVLPPNETILAGSLLVAAMRRFNRISNVEPAIVRIESLESYLLSAPHIRANWKIENGYHFVRLGALDTARIAFESCLTVADENSLLQPKIAAQIGLTRLELSIGATDRARVYLEELDGIPLDRLGKQRGWITHLQARFAMATGNSVRALQLLDSSQEVIREAKFPDSAMNIFEHDRIQILYAMSQFEENELVVSRIAKTSTVADSARAYVVGGLLSAHRLWDIDRTKASALLADSMTRAERLNPANYLPLLPEIAAQLAAYALQANVATEFIKRVIRIRRLQAPNGAPAEWPWHMRVEVLGGFSLKRDGNLVSFAGKAQQKPLELLKYLACERGMIADFHSLTAALWPDAEGNASRKSLEVTVSRLRKLLGEDSLVLVKEGRVSLDRTQVSSDVLELAEACMEAELALPDRCDPATVEKMSRRILNLFKGLPLDNEDLSTWREGVRAHCRTAFVRAVRSLTLYWERVAQDDRSVALIEAAIAREPLAESLYQSLIRIYIRSNQTGEAMRVYRQCRQMLSILIGAKPSLETERLKDSIHL